MPNICAYRNTRTFPSLHSEVERVEKSSFMICCFVKMDEISSSQTSRYIFTVNNYNREFNYKQHLSSIHEIKRVVFGYEIAPTTGTPHLQGYLEFNRSYRLSMCKRVLPNARWDKAIGCSLTNYRYCIKGGHFESIGDWSREVNGLTAGRDGRTRPLSTPMIIASLLNDKTAPQVKVSREYSEKYVFYDRVANFVAKLNFKKTNFARWEQYNLYPWQYEVSTRNTIAVSLINNVINILMHYL